MDRADSAILIKKFIDCLIAFDKSFDILLPLRLMLRFLPDSIPPPRHYQGSYQRQPKQIANRESQFHAGIIADSGLGGSLAFPPERKHRDHRHHPDDNEAEADEALSGGEGDMVISKWAKPGNGGT